MKRIIKRLRKNWDKYLLEIIVIATGILLAFGLNNWNDNRKTENLELKMLHELHASAVFNIEMIEECMGMVQTGQASLDIVLDHITNNLPYDESLAIHFGNAILYCTIITDYNSYETAKSYGLHLFRNDSLRNQLSAAYEIELPFLSTIEGRWRDYNSITVVPIVTKLFDRSTMLSDMHPLNYNELKDQNEYLNVLKTLRKFREVDLLFEKEMLDSMIEIEKMLDKEIARLEGQ